MGASLGFNELKSCIHMFHIESELGNSGTKPTQQHTVQPDQPVDHAAQQIWNSPIDQPTDSNSIITNRFIRITLSGSSSWNSNVEPINPVDPEKHEIIQSLENLQKSVFRHGVFINASLVFVCHIPYIFSNNRTSSLLLMILELLKRLSSSLYRKK